jgi:hypothetical protein
MVVAGGVKRWLTGVAQSRKEVARPGRSGSQGRGQSPGSGARPVIGLRGGDVAWRSGGNIVEEMAGNRKEREMEGGGGGGERKNKGVDFQTHLA